MGWVTRELDGEKLSEEGGTAVVVQLSWAARMVLMTFLMIELAVLLLS